MNAASLAAPVLIDQLVQANHILYAEGVVDGFGHVSARHPSEAGVFLLSRSRAPALVIAADIGCYDLDGKAYWAKCWARPIWSGSSHCLLCWGA